MSSLGYLIHNPDIRTLIKISSSSKFLLVFVPNIISVLISALSLTFDMILVIVESERFSGISN